MPRGDACDGSSRSSGAGRVRHPGGVRAAHEDSVETGASHAYAGKAVHLFRAKLSIRSEPSRPGSSGDRGEVLDMGG